MNDGSLLSVNRGRNFKNTTDVRVCESPHEANAAEKLPPRSAVVEVVPLEHAEGAVELGAIDAGLAFRGANVLPRPRAEGILLELAANRHNLRLVTTHL